MTFLQESFKSAEYSLRALTAYQSPLVVNFKVNFKAFFSSREVRYSCFVNQKRRKDIVLRGESFTPLAVVCFLNRK